MSQHSDQRPSCSLVHFPSWGRARWVGGRCWPLSRRSQFSRKQTFYFPSGCFGGPKLCLFSRGVAFMWFFLVGMPVAVREPNPCYHDACSVGVPKGAHGGRAGRSTVRPLFPPVPNVFFCRFWGVVVWMLHVGRHPRKRTLIPG